MLSTNKKGFQIRTNVLKIKKNERNKRNLEQKSIDTYHQPHNQNKFKSILSPQSTEFINQIMSPRSNVNSIQHNLN